MSQSLGTALVTGASSGIGAVYAERLARRGHDLVLVARRADRLEKLAGELRQRYGVRVENLVADLSKAEDVERVGRRLTEDESIWTLVNNAGVAQAGSLTGGAAVNDADLIQINITALTRLTLAVLSRFQRAGRGNIIQISSVLAFQALPNTAIYSGTKAYVALFTRGLQAELAGTGVRVQLVMPAATRTEIWDHADELASTLPAEALMEVGDLVDAALAGFDQGEAVTVPAVHDANLLGAYEQAVAGIFGASLTGRPAPRYAVHA